MQLYEFSFEVHVHSKVRFLQDEKKFLKPVWCLLDIVSVIILFSRKKKKTMTTDLREWVMSTGTFVDKY